MGDVARDWQYDPDWRAFTRWERGLDEEDPERLVQVIVYEEWTETDHAFVHSYCEKQGLDPTTRSRLRANPAPLSYNGTLPP